MATAPQKAPAKRKLAKAKVPWKPVQYNNLRFNTEDALMTVLRARTADDLYYGYNDGGSYAVPNPTLAGRVRQSRNVAFNKASLVAAYRDYLVTTHGTDDPDPKTLEGDALRAYITKRVLAFDQGCYSGKVEFLTSLGIDPPSQPLVITVEVAGITHEDLGLTRAGTNTNTVRTAITKEKLMELVQTDAVKVTVEDWDWSGND